jgi:hypothetical protein
MEQKIDEALEWFKNALSLYQELKANDLAERTQLNIKNLSKKKDEHL